MNLLRAVLDPFGDGVAVTRDFAPEEVGVLAEVREVAAAVSRA